MKRKSSVVLLSSLLSSLLVATLIVGCGQPTDPKSVLDKTTDHLTSVNHQIVDTFMKMRKYNEFRFLLSGIELLLPRRERTPRPPMPDDKDPGKVPAPRSPSPRQPMPEPKKWSRADIYSFLSTYVFVEENSTPRCNSLVYQVKGAQFCKLFEGRSKTTCTGTSKCKNPPPQKKSSCEQQVDSLDIQLTATLHGPSSVHLSLSVQGGDPVFSMSIASEKLRIKTNLKALESSVKQILQKAGARLPVEWPTTVRGRLALALDYTSTHLAAQVSVEEDVEIKGQSSPEMSYRIFLEKQKDVLSSIFHIQDNKWTAGVNFKAIQLELPGQWLFNIKEQMKLSLAGLSVKFDLKPGKDIYVSNVGIGADKGVLKVKDTPVFMLDINKNHGRTVEFNIQNRVSAQFAILSAFDLKMYLDLGPIKALGQKTKLGAWARAGAWALKNQFQLLVQNGQKIPVLGSSKPSTLLRVKRGQLTLKNLTKLKQMSVLEGHCLVLKQGFKVEAPSLIESLLSVTCP